MAMRKWKFGAIHEDGVVMNVYLVQDGPMLAMTEEALAAVSASHLWPGKLVRTYG